MNYNKTLLAAGVLLSFITLTAEAALTAGTADGQSVVYSSVSDITWTGDANLLGTLITTQGYNNVVDAIIAASPTIYDTPNYYDGSYGDYDGANGRPYSGSYSITAGDFDNSGFTTWFGAQAFTSYLNSISYAGSNQWALPSAGADPQGGDNQTGSQFGQLFYTELGGTAGNPIPDTAYFTNEQAYLYWLGTEYAPIPGYAWYFNTINGDQSIIIKTFQIYAWAVSPGNVAAIPVPGALWLFGSGLIVLLGLKRRGNIG